MLKTLLCPQAGMSLKSTGIRIYRGKGAHDKDADLLHRAITQLVQPLCHKVSYIAPEDIITGSWREETTLLVIGGGYDLGLIQALGSQGQEQIRQFVLTGGSYLGVCSGAYFACDYIEFDRGGPQEVAGERHLKFFPGGCIGPQFADYDYHSRKGARAPSITLDVETGISWGSPRSFKTYFNGGGAFFPHNSNTTGYQENGGEFRGKTRAGLLFSDTEGTLGHTIGEVCEINSGDSHKQQEIGINSRHGDCLAVNQTPDNVKFLKNYKFRYPSSPAQNSSSNSDINSWSTLAYFDEMPRPTPAIVMATIGQGCSVLSSVHFEYEACDLKKADSVEKYLILELVKSEKSRRHLMTQVLKILKCECIELS